MIGERIFYMRNPDVVAIGTSGCYLFVDADGKATETPVSDAASWSLLMRDLMAPTAGAALLRLSADDQRVLERLLEAGLLLEGRDAAGLLDRRDRVFTENRGYHFRRGEPR